MLDTIKRTVFCLLISIINVVIKIGISNKLYKINILMDCFISVIFIVVLYKYLLLKSSYLKINNKYLNISDSLKKYEEMIDKYRVSNHENKNTLLTIRSMIISKEKNIEDYIDTIINTTINDNEKIMFETNIIPSGLKAIIYSKMIYMEEKGIKVRLNIDRKVRNVEINDNNLKLDLCKIVGVFLDNSIEEVIKQINKEIKIKMNIVDNNLNIVIKNKSFNKFDINKIDNPGFTTKNEGHGYGLALVKNILERNDRRIINNKYIENNYFVQELKIINIL